MVAAISSIQSQPEVTATLGFDWHRGSFMMSQEKQGLRVREAGHRVDAGRDEGDVVPRQVVSSLWRHTCLIAMAIALTSYTNSSQWSLR
jgi:hypothetical protein